MARGVVAIIQARTGSSRLPGKVLKTIEGRPLLGRLIERLKMSLLIDEIIIATTTKRKDEAIQPLAQEYGVESFAGSEEDVLDRYYQAAKKYHVEKIVRITSDCPLIDSQVVDRVIQYYMNENRFDYVSNSLKRSYPLGLDTEVFPFEVLEKTWREARKPYEREHVTPYIYEHPEIFCLANVEYSKNLSYMRWTVDEEKDLQFVREIYKRLSRDGETFLMDDILGVLEREPALMEINRNVKQKELAE